MYTIKNEEVSIEIVLSEIKETVWIRLSLSAALQAYAGTASPGVPQLSSMYASQALTPLVDCESAYIASRVSAWVKVLFRADGVMELQMPRSLVPGDIAVWERRVFMALASLVEANVYETCRLPGAEGKREQGLGEVDHIVASFRK